MRLRKNVAGGDRGGGGHGETRPVVGRLGGAGRDPGGVFRDERKCGPILRRSRFEDDVATGPAGGVVAGEERVLRLEIGDVAARGADEHEPVFEEAEIDRGHHVFEFRDVIRAVVLPRGVEDVLRSHRRRGAVRIAQRQRTLFGIIEIAAALIEIEAVPERGAGLRLRPIARIGSDALQRQQVEKAAFRLELIVGAAAEGELQFADPGLLDVGGRSARAAEFVAAQILVTPEFGVGLAEVRVRGAVGERLRDVDVNGVGAAVDRVVAVDGHLVGVAGDFEKEGAADTVVQREGNVAGDLSLRRFFTRPEIRGFLRGDAESWRAGDDGVVTSGGHFEAVDHGLPAEVDAGAGDRAAADEIAVGGGAVAGRAFRAEDVREIHDLAGAERRGIEHPERGKERVRVIGAIGNAGGGLLRGGRHFGRARQDRTGVGCPAIPRGNLIGEKRRKRLLLRLGVFALGAKGGVLSKMIRAGDEDGLLPAPLVLAVRVATLPHAGDTNGCLVIDGLVHVDRRAELIPRPELQLCLANRFSGERLLRDRDRRAAELRGAKENGVGPTREIEAVERVAVSVVVEREKIPHRVVRFAGRGAADRDVNGGRKTEALVHVVAGVVSGVNRPLHRLREIGDVEGVEKFLREHRVGDGRVLELGVEPSAGERARGDEALVAARVHLERRKYDGRVFPGRARGGSRCGLRRGNSNGSGEGGERDGEARGEGLFHGRRV